MMQFNERVLNEAGNPDVPLAERLTAARSSKRWSKQPKTVKKSLFW